MPMDPLMSREEWEQRLSTAFSELLFEGPDNVRTELETLAPHEAHRLLELAVVGPPRVCQACGTSYRHCCMSCREREKREADRAALRAEVLAELRATGEF